MRALRYIAGACLVVGLAMPLVKAQAPVSGPRASAPADASQRLRVGYLERWLPGAVTYSPPRPGAKYYVLARDGTLAFGGDVVAITTPADGNCSLTPKTRWSVRSAASAALPPKQSWAIIVESEKSPTFQSVSPTVIEPSAPLTQDVQALTTEKLNLRGYTATYYDVGHNASRSRIVALLVGADRPPGGPSAVVVVVADVTPTGVTEQIVYEIGSNGEDLFDNLQGVADTNGDGLADAVLVAHGDFYGARLLVQDHLSNGWYTVNESPGTC